MLTFEEARLLSRAIEGALRGNAEHMRDELVEAREVAERLVHTTNPDTPVCRVEFSTNTDAHRESREFETADILSALATRVEDGNVSGVLYDTLEEPVGEWSVTLPLVKNRGNNLA